MFRSRGNGFLSSLLFLTILIMASCGFIDLRPVGFTVEPEVSDTVLQNGYTPLVLSFDTEMEKPSAEGILKISADNGMVDGDISWKGNSLYFVPVPPWTAGTRYTLSLSGMARALDGRELRIEKNVFFYAINKSAPPLVEWFSPADGASLGIRNTEINSHERGASNSAFIRNESPFLSPPLRSEPAPRVLRYPPDSTNSLSTHLLKAENTSASFTSVEIHFSCPMERSSTESAFSVDGFGEKIFIWSLDDRHLEIIPREELSPWTVYRWTIKAGAKSREGVPLAKEVSAQFSTDSDRLIPKVEKVYPAINSGGLWRATGGGIEKDLGPGQGIAILFNKPVGDDSLNAVRFDPSLPGRTERISETCIVFIPSKDPEPETAYTLVVSADAKDSDGLRTGTEYRINFVADIPYLRVLSFGADGIPAVDNTVGQNGDGALAVPVDNPGGGVLRFTLRFSLPFDARAKQDAALKISLQPFFPGTLAPVALRFVTWLSDDRLRMEWEGLKPGTSDSPLYYRLLLPGGRGGIETGEGMYLKEDQYIYLEAR